MFYCERCGTSFNASAAPSAMACPRCRAKDGVFVPLTFTIRSDRVVGGSGSPAVGVADGGRRSESDLSERAPPGPPGPSPANPSDRRRRS